MVESTGPLRRKGFSGGKGQLHQKRKEKRFFAWKRVERRRKTGKVIGKVGFFLSVDRCKIGGPHDAQREIARLGG